MSVSQAYAFLKKHKNLFSLFFFFYLPGWVGNGHLFTTTQRVVLGKIITLLQLYPGKSHIILLFYFGQHSLCFTKSMRTWEPSDFLFFGNAYSHPFNKHNH